MTLTRTIGISSLVLLLLTVTSSSSALTDADGDPFWWCSPSWSEEYGEIHVDGQTGDSKVIPPDGKHKTWGLDGCLDSHSPYVGGV